MKMLNRAAWVLAGLLLAVLLAGQVGLFQGSPPADLGVNKGRLKPPSLTPNSVSSQAALNPGHPQAGYAQIEPFTYTGDGFAAMVRLAETLRQFPRTRIVEQRTDYLRAECSTPVMGFTDDVEFWLDEAAHVIHLRSASRLGRSDMGANRRRIEAIRTLFKASPATIEKAP